MARISEDLHIGRFKIPYRIYGTDHPGRPPLVCVNGAQQSMAAWKSLINHFKRKCRVVVFDFPGQGRGDTVSGGDRISLNEQVDVLGAVLDRTVGNRNVNIMASSWGGAPVCAYLADNQHRVEKVILAGFGLRLNEYLKAKIRQGQREIMNGNFAECGRIIIRSMGQGLPAAMQRQIAAQFAEIKESHMRSFHEHMLWSMDLNLSSLIDFSAIKASILILCGELDRIVDKNSLLELHDRLPDSRLRFLPDTGHFLHFEDRTILNIYEDYFLDAKSCESRDLTPVRPGYGSQFHSVWAGSDTIL